MLLNAAGAIAAAGHAADLREGLELARTAIDSGAAGDPPRRADRVLAGGRGVMRFADALAAPGFGAIAEFKRRSPSAGDLRPGGDVAEVARSYERAGARAMSVLVDERFAGTWDDLRAARAATSLPLLAKGFFSTADDLRTAREAGADAALLLLRDLDDATCAALMREAEALGLDTLVEAHDAERARPGDRARRAGDRRQRPRPLDLRDRPPRPARAARPGAARPDRRRRVRDRDARPGRGRRARRARRRCSSARR